MDIEEEKKKEMARALTEAITNTIPPEFAVLFTMALLEGMKIGKKILENMTPEEKEELRKKFNP